jgi:MFS family permease
VTGSLRLTVGYWSVAGGILVTTMLSNGPGAIYALYRQKWNLSPLTITAIFAVAFMFLLVTLVFTGGSSDVLGRRPVMILAVVLNLASTAAFFFASGVGWLFLARAIQGASNGLLVGPATAALVEMDPKGNYRRASLVSTVALMVGSSLGPLLFGLLAQYTHSPTKSPYATHFVIVLFVLLGMYCVPHERSRAARATIAGDSAKSQWRLLVRRPRFPDRRRRLFLLASSTLAVTWSLGSFWASLTSLVTSQLLHDNSRALPGEILFAYFGLAGAVQLVAHRWDHKRAMLWGVVAVAVGIGLLELAITTQSTLVLICAILSGGTGAGISYMGATAIVVFLATPERRAAVIAAYNVIGYVAVAIPVMVLGVAATQFGLRDATNVFVIIGVVVSAVLSWAIWREPTLDHHDSGDELLEVMAPDPIAAAEQVAAADQVAASDRPARRA